MQAGGVESRADRRARNRSLAGFFAAGATVSTTLLLLPGWEQLHTVGIAGTAVLAALGAAILFVLDERLGPGATHALTSAGTALIAACQVLAGGGSPTGMYAMLYIWVILYASLFSSKAATAGHLALTTLAHAAALGWLGDVTHVGPPLALTLVTQAAAALIVRSLASRQRDLADTDWLTGLGNRRVAERSLEWALQRSRRSATPTCVAVLDLDGFKAFNDRRGHLAGDQVLVAAAAAWRGLVRDTDVLCRTGGDEFFLVLPDCPPGRAEEIVRRLADASPPEVACSVGLATWDGHETAAALTDRADRALYAAKEHGPVARAPETATREAS